MPKLAIFSSSLSSFIQLPTCMPCFICVYICFPHTADPTHTYAINYAPWFIILILILMLICMPDVVPYRNWTLFFIFCGGGCIIWIYKYTFNSHICCCTPKFNILKFMYTTSIYVSYDLKRPKEWSTAINLASSWFHCHIETNKLYLFEVIIIVSKSVWIYMFIIRTHILINYLCHLTLAK